MGPPEERRRWQLDRGDQLAVLQHRLLRRVLAIADVELAEGNLALAPGAQCVDYRVQRRHRHAHVGRMRGDAVIAGAEDRVAAIEALERRTAGAGLALVTWPEGVAEVRAARPLHEVAADRAQLGSCGGAPGSSGP